MSVTYKLIEDRPVMRPGEILEFVPGMIITQHSGDGKANQYFLRGYNLDHGTDFATYVAGMPVNNPTHAHGQGYADLNFVIPELVSGIQFKKGPYYADEGDFSTVGAAHIEYFDKLPYSTGLALVTLGSYDYTRALVAGSPEVGDGHLLMAFEYQGTNGPWTNPEDFNKYNGVMRYSQGNALSGFNITAMAYDAKWNSTDQVPQSAVDSGFIPRFGAIDPSDGGQTTRYSLSFEGHGPDERARIAAMGGRCVRHRLQPRSVEQLHLFPRRCRRTATSFIKPIDAWSTACVPRSPGAAR